MAEKQAIVTATIGLKVGRERQNGVIMWPLPGIELASKQANGF